MTNEEKITEMKKQMGGIKEKVKSEIDWLEICCGYDYNIDIAQDAIIGYVSKVEKYLEGVLNE